MRRESGARGMRVNMAEMRLRTLPAGDLRETDPRQPDWLPTRAEGSGGRASSAVLIHLIDRSFRLSRSTVHDRCRSVDDRARARARAQNGSARAADVDQRAQARIGSRRLSIVHAPVSAVSRVVREKRTGRHLPSTQQRHPQQLAPGLGSARPRSRARPEIHIFICSHIQTCRSASRALAVV